MSERHLPYNTHAVARLGFGRTRQAWSLALVTVVGWIAAPTQAQACWLTDLLYGRPQTSVAAGPVFTPGYAAGYGGYVAGYGGYALPANGVNSSLGVSGNGMSDSSFNGQTFLGGGIRQPTLVRSLPYGITSTRGAAAPPTRVNRYAAGSAIAGYDNPSVYTGRPVVSGFRGATPVVTSSTFPLASGSLPLRGGRTTFGPDPNRATTSNQFFGTGNQYPTNMQVTSRRLPLGMRSPGQGLAGNQGAVLMPAYGAYVPGATAASGYNAAGYGVPGAGVSGQSGGMISANMQPQLLDSGTLPVPPTALPPANVAPLFGQGTAALPADPRRGGLARFFDSLLGTGYRTSYYQAPITYYRPIDTTDPSTGQIVTTQRACESTVMQLQRTPYRTALQNPTMPFGSGDQAVCTTDYVYDPCPPGGIVLGSTGVVGASGLESTVAPRSSIDPGPPSSSALSPTFTRPTRDGLVPAPLVGRSPLGSGDNATVPQPRIEAMRQAPLSASPQARFAEPAVSAGDDDFRDADDFAGDDFAGDDFARNDGAGDVSGPETDFDRDRDAGRRNESYPPSPNGFGYSTLRPIPADETDEYQSPFGDLENSKDAPLKLQAPDLLDSTENRRREAGRVVIPAQVAPFVRSRRSPMSANSTDAQEIALEMLPAPTRNAPAQATALRRLPPTLNRVTPNRSTRPMFPPVAERRPTVNSPRSGGRTTAAQESHWKPIRQPAG